MKKKRTNRPASHLVSSGTAQSALEAHKAIFVSHPLTVYRYNTYVPSIGKCLTFQQLSNGQILSPSGGVCGYTEVILSREQVDMLIKFELACYYSI
jgi:hypothetical protein